MAGGIPNANINFRKEALRCAKAAARQLALLREQREQEAAAAEIPVTEKQDER
jgi:hypothetical protein